MVLYFPFSRFSVSVFSPKEEVLLFYLDDILTILKAELSSKTFLFFPVINYKSKVKWKNVET